MTFSEKSWIYLLACQLFLSDGADSILTALIGLFVGWLYLRDRAGIQNIRLPRQIEV
jgi:hypothetical protein